MRYAFIRGGRDIRNWDQINKELAGNLEEIREGRCPKEEMELFLLKAVHDASVDEENETASWGYANPSSMPADTRCDYFYKPTYLITASMVSIVNRYPDLLQMADVEDTLCYALNACTGRHLRDSGYDAYDGLCNNVLLFMQNGIIRFMRKYPLFSVSFERTFRNALNQIIYDYHAGKQSGFGWHCKDKQKAINDICNEMGYSLISDAKDTEYLNYAGTNP